ncbi:MAG: Holliday junction resolvase RuvX [Bacteroidales bacterium]|jgi:putative Holliday junction resolvase
MGRLFAIDYGRKRVGIAVSDESMIIASPLTTVRAHDIFDFIAEYSKENKIEAFILGLALDMNGNHSESMQYIIPFSKRLQKLYPKIKLYWVDERFTSVMAQRAILMSGAKKSKRQDKALVDKISAAIILETFMNSKEFIELKNSIKL